ncbi:MAG TPA: amidase family protein, partial [Mycobacterium sp.]|nr:amidase family protein [Mycobacterium sp.]
KPQRGRISTWPLPEAFNGLTVYGVLARTVTDAALLLDAASGNVDGDLHKPPPVRASEHVGVAPGPLKIAMSLQFPFTGLRARLHPEILAAMTRLAGQLESVGHTIMAGDPTYGLRLSSDFLARSASGLLDWADRVGDGATLEPRTLANIRLGRVTSKNALRRARRAEAAAERRIGKIFDTVDVVLTPTTPQPPALAHAFDHRGTLATDRAMIAGSSLCWPWNVVGWPAVNVPAGFTESGLPVGVQLMGPVNSEPLLVSLAAELEAVSGWATKQPAVWWNTPVMKELPARFGSNVKSNVN